MIRRLAVVSLFLFASACASSRYVGYRMSPDSPPLTGEIRLAALAQSVSITFDEHAIPHIDAASDADALAALGYVHARERLFQMELMRRAAYGRLSEMFGNQRSPDGALLADTLAIDRWMRGLGVGRMGDREAAAMDDDSRRLALAYAAGINAYIENGERPIELRLLDVEPEPWTPAHVVAVGRLTGFGLALNMPHELIRFSFAAELGEDVAEETFPRIDEPGPAIIESRIEDRGLRIETSQATVFDRKPWHDAALAIAGAHGSAASVLSLYAPAEASNNWVISGSRSASGKPILANDPHLAHGVPSIFCMAHLKSPNFDAIGVTIPGTPLVILGHNRHLAWAATTTFADTQDIYLERLDPNDPNRYLTPDGSEAFETRVETIRVKDGGKFEEHRVTLRRTRHGAVMDDFFDGMPKSGGVVALRSAMDDGSEDYRAMMLVARATTVAEFRDAMSFWHAPIQNWLVADTSGGIGYYPAGRVPQRVGWDGTRPVPGWTDEFEWGPYIAANEIPQLFDPSSGMIVTANNKVVHPNAYPWPYSYDASPGYRAARIRELLASREKWDADGMREMQADTYSKQGESLRPALLAALESAELTERERFAAGILRSWDLHAREDSAGATIFYQTYGRAWTMTLADDLSPRLFGVLNNIHYIYGFFDRLWREVPNARVFDDKTTPAVETRDDILVAAFKAAINGLAVKYGDDPAAWTWGTVHQITFKHPFGSVGGIGGFFNVGPLPIPGERGTIWAAKSAHTDDFTSPVAAGPVFRHVVDMAHPETSFMIIDVGQSGWPGTRYYANAAGDWQAGSLWRVEMDEAAYEAGAVGRLTLAP
ncbi:penicillin acylase family protein [bacterium]|nr:penicillin acylase family protein [bacterium]